MMIILLALLSAFFFAAHSVAVRGGLKGSNPMTATLVSAAPCFSLLLTFVFLKELEKLTVNVISGAVLIVAAVAILTVFS